MLPAYLFRALFEAVPEPRFLPAHPAHPAQDTAQPAAGACGAELNADRVIAGSALRDDLVWALLGGAGACVLPIFRDGLLPPSGILHRTSGRGLRK